MSNETFEAACARHRVEIAGSLRKQRLLANMTQEELANAIAVPQGTISRMESGQRPVPCELLWRIADLYDVTIDALIGHETADEGGAQG
jgi:transcriptional regulator with XRE-family HTH domain